MNFSPVVLTGAGTSGIFVLIAYIAVFAVLMYFLSVRPQKKRQKTMDAMIANLAVGDSISDNKRFPMVLLSTSRKMLLSLSSAVTDIAVSQCRKKRLSALRRLMTKNN